MFLSLINKIPSNLLSLYWCIIYLLIYSMVFWFIWKCFPVKSSKKLCSFSLHSSINFDNDKLTTLWILNTTFRLCSPISRFCYITIYSLNQMNNLPFIPFSFSLVTLCYFKDGILIGLGAKNESVVPHF